MFASIFIRSSSLYIFLAVFLSGFGIRVNRIRKFFFVPIVFFEELVMNWY